MKLVPMPGVVLVEPIKDDSIIQSTGRDYTNAAVVINAGDWVQMGKPENGDTLFYDEFAYRRFEHEGKDIFAVDIRGDGVWLIGKQDQDERTNTEPVQEEGVSASVSASSPAQ